MIDLPAPVSPADYAHPAIQLKIEMLNDGVVVYGKVHEHGRPLPGFRSGYLYSVFVQCLTILTLSSAFA
jgi:hypothetical protein